jgi:hypothetical protein
MPGTFAIDTAATFTTCMLVNAGPKPKFGAADQQETNAQGMPKWLLEVAVTFAPGAPGMPAISELIAVTVTGPHNPVEGVPAGTPITFDGLRAGLNAPEHGQNGRIRGGKLWYTATAIRPALASSGRRSESAA